MSDNTPWQSPSGPTPPSTPDSPYSPPPPAGTPAFPPPGAQPTYSPPGQPSYAPPAQPGYAQQPQAGWTPPPKPGLIPLRPMTLGTILGAAFQVLRRNPRPTFGFALLVTGAISVVTVGVVGFVAFFAIARTASATGADVDELAAGSVASVILAALVPVALALVGSAILQGIISLEVARGTLGEKHRLGGLWRAARGRIGALIGWSALIAAVVIIAIAIVAVIIALLVAAGGAAGAGVAVLLGLLVGAGGVVLAFWLGTKLSLVPSVLLLERLRLREAIVRSWSLTNGFFWRTLGIMLLVSVILQTATSIVSAPLNFIVGIGAGLLNPNGDPTAMIGFIVVLYVATIVIVTLLGAITAVVQGAVPALLYIDIRMRKEGLDLELTRFVEARQAGDTSVPDPYLVKSGTVQAAAAPEGSPWA